MRFPRSIQPAIHAFGRDAHDARAYGTWTILPLAVALLTACAGGAARTAQSPAPLASTADSTAVAATLTRMFDALRNSDGTTLRELLHPDARFTLLRPTPGAGNVARVAVMTGEQFVNATTGPNGNGWRVLSISDSFSREGCGGLWTP